MLTHDTFPDRPLAHPPCIHPGEPDNRDNPDARCKPLWPAVLSILLRDKAPREAPANGILPVQGTAGTSQRS